MLDLMLIYRLIGMVKGVMKISTKGIKCLLSLFNIFYTPEISSCWLLCAAAPKYGSRLGKNLRNLSLSLYPLKPRVANSTNKTK